MVKIFATVVMEILSPVLYQTKSFFRVFPINKIVFSRGHRTLLGRQYQDLLGVAASLSTLV